MEVREGGAATGLVTKGDKYWGEEILTERRNHEFFLFVEFGFLGDVFLSLFFFFSFGNGAGREGCVEADEPALCCAAPRRRQADGLPRSGCYWKEARREES